MQDIPVRTALQLIAEISELNIVVADSVTGNVTLRLNNVPWDQALDIVLQAKGLDKRRNGNVIWIAPQKEIADREQALADARLKLQDVSETITEYIPVSYGKAKDIVDLLTQKAKQATGGGGAAATGRSERLPFLTWPRFLRRAHQYAAGRGHARKNRRGTRIGVDAWTSPSSRCSSSRVSSLRLTTSPAK